MAKVTTLDGTMTVEISGLDKLWLLKSHLAGWWPAAGKGAVIDERLIEMLEVVAARLRITREESGNPGPL